MLISESNSPNNDFPTPYPTKSEISGIGAMIQNLIQNSADKRIIQQILAEIHCIITRKNLTPSLKQDFLEAYVACEAYLQNFIPEFRVRDRLMHLLSNLQFLFRK